nr:hypothetical protein KitaXyl93_51720 [Kitasatospora sp. Xyl93]
MEGCATLRGGSGVEAFRIVGVESVQLCFCGSQFSHGLHDPLCFLRLRDGSPAHCHRAEKRVLLIDAMKPGKLKCASCGYRMARIGDSYAT